MWQNLTFCCKKFFYKQHDITSLFVLTIRSCYSILSVSLIKYASCTSTQHYISYKNKSLATQLTIIVSGSSFGPGFANLSFPFSNSSIAADRTLTTYSYFNLSPICNICEKTCANLNKSCTTEIPFARLNCSACNQSCRHRSKYRWSAKTAPRNMTGWGTSGLRLPRIRSRIVRDSMCRELRLRRMASSSCGVWHSVQFS